MGREIRSFENSKFGELEFWEIEGSMNSKHTKYLSFGNWQFAAGQDARSTMQRNFKVFSLV